MDGKSCCSPSANRSSEAGADDCGPAGSGVLTLSAQAGSREGMVELEGGRFLMGSDDEVAWKTDGEGPVREVTLDPFWIDQTCVTNEAFSSFVEETGFRTEAEKFGWSFVFLNLLPKSKQKTAELVTVQGMQWWARVEKADWKRPGGPGTHIRGQGDHPVVHVSWNDALAFATWMGKRLPSEAEWEYAARGGLEQALYPWGNELTPGGKHRCNIWQGEFPRHDTGEDGYTSTAPARSFRANEFGLYNVSGNVWEWANDWFSAMWQIHGERKNPEGPKTGSSRVIRGGSFLCHDSYCNRYRVSARSKITPDTSTCHLGFRCAL